MRNVTFHQGHQDLQFSPRCNHSAVPQMRERGLHAINLVCRQADDKADAVLLNGWLLRNGQALGYGGQAVEDGGHHGVDGHKTSGAGKPKHLPRALDVRPRGTEILGAVLN